jgi:glutamate 5-kinase
VQVHGQADEILNTKGDTEERGGNHAWGPEHTPSDSTTQSLRSKVAAAWRCAEAGGTAVVMSGLEPDNIQRVCQGEKIGTMFNKQSALDVCMRGMQNMSGVAQLNVPGMGGHALDALMLEKVRRL